MAVGLVAAGAALPSTSALTPGTTELVGQGGSPSLLLRASGPPVAPDSGYAGATFSISGRVTGLYPGDKRPLVLTLRNPNTYAISVTSIHTTVGNASPKCVASDVGVTTFTGHVSVSAKKTVRVTVHAHMLHSTPNACQGAVFPFHYSGLATRA